MIVKTKAEEIKDGNKLKSKALKKKTIKAVLDCSEAKQISLNDLTFKITLYSLPTMQAYHIFINENNLDLVNGVDEDTLLDFCTLNIQLQLINCKKQYKDDAILHVLTKNLIEIINKEFNIC
jgi:hypothetical protein